MTPATAIVFTLPMRLVTESNAKGRHWAAKHRRAKAQRHAAFMMATAYLVRARSPLLDSLLPCRITVTRIAPRRLDVDNAWSSVKHVIDGVADAFNLPDNAECFEWAVGQRRGRPREYAVEIRIEQRERKEPKTRRDQRRWSDADVLAIRTMLRNGARYRDVQVRYGGSLCAIARLRQGITYSDVGGSTKALPEDLSNMGAKGCQHQ